MPRIMWFAVVYTTCTPGIVVCFLYHSYRNIVGSFCLFIVHHVTGTWTMLVTGRLSEWVSEWVRQAGSRKRKAFCSASHQCAVDSEALKLVSGTSCCKDTCIFACGRRGQYSDNTHHPALSKALPKVWWLHASCVCVWWRGCSPN